MSYSSKIGDGTASFQQRDVPNVEEVEPNGSSKVCVGSIQAKDRAEVPPTRT